MSTVLVTMMPYWAERIGVPRTLGVEFPYGHPLGMPHDHAMQMRVIREALRLLEEATEPGEVRHLDVPWPQEFEVAKRDWHPPVPSPIIRMMRERARGQREMSS